MIAGVPWTDAVFAAVLGFALLKGASRGFVKELGGLFATAAALIAPWYYNGSADPWIARTTGLTEPFSHAVGVLLTIVLAYAIVMGIVWIVGSIVKLPVLGTGNAIAGAAIGFIKGFVFLWVVLYVGLFFPLTPAIRANLHESHLAPFLTAYDSNVDGAVAAMIPPFARTYLQPYLDRHHV